MSNDSRTIWTTESLRDAQAMRDVLAAAGVSAVLLRDPFAPTGPTGAAQVHVQVAAADEVAARRAVGHFEQGGRADAEGTVLDARPRCPECDALRITCCPVCQTAGHDFPQADFEFSVPPDFVGAEESLACGCAAEPPGDPATPADSVPEAVHDDAPEPPIMLTCTICDEPFVPRYLKRCEWCGHTFPDGIEFALPDEPAEPLNARVTIVFLALAVASLAVLAWLAYVL